MKPPVHTLIVVAALGLVLAACGEKPQAMGGVRQDAAPYTGTGTAYAVPGWKQGDKASWEQQLRARTQTGQNDNVKTN